MKLITIFLLVSTIALADNAKKWQSLTPMQQQLLQPFESDWHALDNKTQNYLLKKINQWNYKQNLERQKIRRQLNRFTNKSTTQKITIIDKFIRFENLPPEKRKQIRQAQKRFKNLPPQKRKQLRSKFKRRNLMVRQEPASGKTYPIKAKQFINQFDISKRASLKHMFKSLPPRYKHAMRVRLKKLTQAEQHIFVLNLLEMKPPQRLIHLDALSTEP